MKPANQVKQATSVKKIDNVVWDEMLELPVIHPEAELAGYAQGLPKRFEVDSVLLHCARLPVARRLLRLWKGLKEVPINAKIASGEGLLGLDRAKSRAIFRLPLGVYREILSKGPEKSDRWDWLRGVWGATGSLYSPQNGYHVVLRIKDEEEAGQIGSKLLKVLRRAGIVPGVRTYRGSTEYMIRSQENVVTFLARMRLVKSSLAIEETAMIRSMKGRANTMVNCDAANIGKSLTAAREQLALVGKIENKGLWNAIGPQMKELARLRISNPSASLRELGQMLERPVSKSTVEYRWKRLESLIQDL